MAEGLSSPAADEVKPYSIHIPSKHLDLTRQKLELTRLPHEPSPASDSNTWAPKPIIEPLIDYWLESYSWRTTESQFNTNPHLPQFRTAITPPDSHAPIRIHFIHARSHTPGAIPLLVIPPFPLPALSLAPLIPLLTGTPTQPGNGSGSPDETQHQRQYFHVIIPSLSGTAFSDPLPPSFSPDINPIPTTATILNTLMHRLGYPAYLATATSPSTTPSTTNASIGSGGAAGAGRIGELIVRRLVTAHGASCVGGHLVCPVLRAPRLGWRGGWRGVVVRVLLRRGGGDGNGGYEWGRGRGRERERGGGGRDGGGSGGGGGGGGLGRVAEPDTLAYALCDSPVGMLAFLLRGLRLAAGGGKAVFTRDELITLANLMWLPGPEGMLRFWAACGRHMEEDEKPARGHKPKVAITVFAGADGSQKGKQPETATAVAVAEGDEETAGLWPTAEEVAARKESYYPPAWANTLFDVVHIQRVAGPSSGLLAWEQPEVILAGVRGLAKAVLAKDSRLVSAVSSTGVPVESADAGKQAAGAVVEGQKPVAATGSSEDSSPAGAVEGAPAASGAAAQGGDHKGKGKDAERLAPPVVVSSVEDESPGTLVNTPPLEEAR
ncbi:Alpha/Beta hydrolase protein [Chaetomium tenue]|uniref:Alpha/Beta hydrolase protein n=1 Tax=Chaetomium tenue TaxID=1854479 RepID=A0ACB7PH77_9PEZI|nr:Alpha/Beta hydrolase protein [Chaetomium globosum]